MSLANKLSVADLTVTGKRVLVRVDFNVPFNKEGTEITNTARIDAAIPTIKHLIDNGAKTVVLCSHLGRPDGKVVAKYSLKLVADKLAEIMGMPVTFVNNCVGDEAVAASNAGGLVLLENLRFHVEEEGKGKDAEGVAVKADPAAVKTFREQLRALGDVYVCDAFGTAHRGHSSMVGEGFEERACGFLVKAELDAFSKILDAPSKPFLAIMGGAKVSDKIQLIQNLLDKVDRMIIGGGMAYTFLKVVYGMEIGNSLFDKAGAEIVQGIVDAAKEKNVELFFPVDFVAGDDFSESANTKIVTKEEGIPEGWEGFDCGPATRAKFAEVVKSSKTVVFNGPVGVFELTPYMGGTKALLESCAEAVDAGTIVVVGGGDTATAALKFGVDTKMSHVSTGGGASLCLLEGQALPGVEALSTRN